MRALSRVAAGVAGFGLAVAVLFAGAGVAADGPGVDRAEGRGGEGGEYERVPGHGLRDALASGQPGADQVEGVAPVGFGATRAGGGPPVAARLVDHVVGQVVSADRAGDLSGRGVHVADGAAQQDGPGTGGCSPHMGQPGVVSVQPGRGGWEGDLFQAGVDSGRGADGRNAGDQPAVAGAVERGGGGVEAAEGRRGHVVPGTCPRARSLSGRESQHRDAGMGHGRPPPLRAVPLTAVTGGGVMPPRSVPARTGGMPSRSASSPSVMGRPVACWWWKAVMRALMTSCPDATASRS